MFSVHSTVGDDQKFATPKLKRVEARKVIIQSTSYYVL